MDDIEQYLEVYPGVRDAYEEIGRITARWNAVELTWYLIGTCLLHEISREKLDAIWKQFATGAAQRKFILAVAETAFSNLPLYAARIRALSRASDILAQNRNDTIHGLYRIDLMNGPPTLRLSPTGVSKRKENQLAKESAELKVTLAEVTSKIEAHYAELDDFRLILVQEFLPPEKRQRPLKPEQLEKIPSDIRNLWGREMLERIAPPDMQIDE